MQPTRHKPFVPPAFLDRMRLRRAATRYAAHGWAVTPGACLSGSRFDCERPGCPIMGCHPARESWADDAGTDLAQVSAWWRHRPHAVLLATGHAFDAIEMPAALGLRVLGLERLRGGLGGPVAALPEGRWIFLVRPGVELRPSLRRRLDVVRHGLGSWIPAAPSRTPDGPVRWAVTPAQVHWQLPDADGVQGRLDTALGRQPGVRRIVKPAVPRQVSTGRRAA